MKPERKEKIMRTAAMRQLDVAVVLEEVHDTHNIAAVMRTCDAVGIQTVYAVYSDGISNLRKYKIGKRASAGTRKWVDVFVYEDRKRCIADIQSRYHRLLGAALGANSASIYDCNFTGSCAIAFGNEHVGLSNDLIDACDSLIHVPQIGMAQSLNISVACAVTLYELFRQRHKAGMYERTVSDALAIRSLQDKWIARHKDNYRGSWMKEPGSD